MKTETVERIMRMIDAEVQRTRQFKNWDEAMEFTKETFGTPDGVLPFAGGRLLSRAELREVFSKEPEPTQRELDLGIKKLKTDIRSLRTKLLEAVKKELPVDPGGRHSVLGSSTEQERRIQQVLAHIKTGMRVTESLKRVARKEGISLAACSVFGK